VAFDPDAMGGLIVYSQGEASGAELVAAPLSSLATPASAAGSKTKPGSKGWTFALDKPTRGGPTIADGKVFVGTDGGSVYSVDESTGAQVWRAAPGGTIEGPPAVSGGRVFAVAESGKGFIDRLVASYETTGKMAWEFTQTIGAAGATAPTASDGRVFVGLGDGSIRAFRVSNGDPLWAQGGSTTPRPDSAPAVAGDSVYVADPTAGLERFRVDDGRREWNFLFEPGVTPGAPLVAASIVYTGMSDGSIAAIDQSSGNLVWRSPTGTGPLGPLAPVGDSLIAQHQGAQGSIEAFAHDPAGTLTNIPSPSRLDLGRALLDYIAALVIVLAFLAIFWLLEARVQRHRTEAAT
jgi:outer membrane protein assembly factor BamB